MMVLHSFRRPIAAIAFVCLFGLASSAMAAMPIQRVVSPHGIVAWLVQDRTVPVISFNFAFRGGTATDPAGKAGRANMVSGLLDEGAGDIKSEEFQASLEDISAHMRFSSSTEWFRGSLRTLSANRDKAFSLLALAITKPRFDQKPVERIRAQIIAGLRSSMQDPDEIASRTWYHQVFPDHPYGQPNDGTLESVKTITIKDLRDFTSRYFARQSLVVGVAGDISADELAKRLDEVFGALPEKGPADTVPDVTPSAAGRLTVIERNVPQSVVLFGQPGVKRDDPDWYTVYVMMHILGDGGFSSRLTEEVREKRGLAYSVYAYPNPYEHTALIVGGVATANARVAESLKVIRHEWRRMAEKGVSAEELANTKTYINGSFPLRMDSTRRIAGMLVAVQINGLGIDYLSHRADYINKVTVDDISRVAKRLLKPEDLTVVVVGRPVGLKASN